MDINTNSLNDFWNSEQGKFGKWGLLGVGILGLGGLYMVRETIIGLLNFSLHAVGMAITIGIVVALALAVYKLVTDPTNREYFGIWYKGLMEKVYGKIRDTNMLPIVQGYIQQWKEYQVEVRRQRDVLNGQVSKIENLIADFKNRATKAATLAAQSVETKNTQASSMYMRQVEQYRTSVEKLSGLLDNLKNLATFIGKAYVNMGYKIQEMEFEVNLQIETFEATTTAANALNSASEVMNPDPTKSAIFNQTMGEIAEKIGAETGIIRGFVEDNATTMQSYDIENGVFAGDAQKLLERYKGEGDLSWLFEERKDKPVRAEIISSSTVNPSTDNYALLSN